jgi:hypothetical protein
VDVCRQSVIFASVADLLVCLRAAATDPSVTLERIKNRMSPCSSAEETAGYRDVGFNLRVVTAEAALLGVDGHVCEVQLLLLPFAKIKVHYSVGCSCLNVKRVLFY